MDNFDLPGKLIVIEGIDGSGKSTLADQIMHHLHHQGHQVRRITRYMLPELTHMWYRFVDEDIADQEMGITLACADYFSGLERFIRPFLMSDNIIIADRYFYSHMIYFTLRGIDLNRIRKMFYNAISPDIVFYVSISVDEAINRLRTKMKPNFWEAGLDYQLGMSIGKAYKMYHNMSCERQKILLEENFRNHNIRAIDLYPKILPPGRTYHLDGHLPTDRLLRESIKFLEPVLSSSTL